MDTNNKLERAIGKIWLVDFLDGLWLPIPVYVLYILDQGISMSELGILMGLAAVFQFLLDIPSSVWADRYSRRSVLVLSGIAYLLCDVAFLFGDSFAWFIPAFAFWGITTALVSGILSAFTYDTLLSFGREAEYEAMQAKIMRGFFSGRAIASLTGVYLYLINPRWVFALALLVNLLMIGVICTLQEPPREKSIGKSWRQVRESVHFLLRRPKIWNLVIIFSLMVATCDTAYSYYQPILRACGVAVSNLGMIYFAVSVCSFTGSALYTRLGKRIDWRTMMAAYLLIDLFVALAFSTLEAVLVLAGMALLSLAYGSQYTFMSNIIHRCVPSSHRATTLSIQGQMYMLFYAVIMSAVGFVTDRGALFSGMMLNAWIIVLISVAFLSLYANRSGAAATAKEYKV